TDPLKEPIVFTQPVAGGEIVQDYAMETLVYWSTLKHYAVHNGIDFGGDDGAAVVAAYAGTVKSVDYDPLYGNVVTIDHGEGLVTSYGSLNEPLVTVGQEVKAGDQIGGMSISASNEMLLGPHVHFSVFLDGEVVSPYDYLPDGDK
ncbi:MAG: M23 family metallopeptidase, partial [Clostridia bacterium]